MRFLVALLLFSTASHANPQIDALFSAYAGQVPGAQVGIFKNGSLEYAKGYGLRHVANNEPVDAITNFRLASLTKQFTAMSVLILVSEGHLSLDTKAIDVLPGFPSYAAKVSVRNLLNHTGGLPDYEDSVGSGHQVSDYEVLGILNRKSSLLFSAGSRYQYSNSGYVVLGLVVESVSGMLFSDFMRSKIFNPLAMETSTLYEQNQPFVENRAYGYTGTLLTDQNETSATRGDGGVYTNASEWLRWDEALNHHTLIPESLQQEMFRPGKLNSGAFTQYGFGWMLDQFQGVSSQEHTGSTIGFRTAVQRYPTKGLTVLVLINRAASAPWDIGRRIAQLYF